METELNNKVIEAVGKAIYDAESRGEFVDWEKQDTIIKADYWDMAQAAIDKFLSFGLSI